MAKLRKYDLVGPPLAISRRFSERTKYVLYRLCFPSVMDQCPSTIYVSPASNVMKILLEEDMYIVHCVCYFLCYQCLSSVYVSLPCSNVMKILLEDDIYIFCFSSVMEQCLSTCRRQLFRSACLFSSQITR